MSCNKHINLVQNDDKGRGHAYMGVGLPGKSVISAQFFYEPKTFVKCKNYLFKNIPEDHSMERYKADLRPQCPLFRSNMDSGPTAAYILTMNLFNEPL